MEGACAWQPSSSVTVRISHRGNGPSWLVHGRMILLEGPPCVLSPSPCLHHTHPYRPYYQHSSLHPHWSSSVRTHDAIIIIVVVTVVDGIGPPQVMSMVVRVIIVAVVVTIMEPWWLWSWSWVSTVSIPPTTGEMLFVAAVSVVGVILVVVDVIVLVSSYVNVVVVFMILIIILTILVFSSL